MRLIGIHDEAVRFLSDIRDVDARLWLYHIRHKRLAIRIRPANINADCFFIIAIGCSHISGPFDWTNITLNYTGYEKDHVLEDAANGFRLQMGHCIIAIASESEFEAHFHEL